MKRTARRAIEATVPILGILIILSSVLLNPDITVQLDVTVLLIGVLILLTGPPWKLTRAFLPDERVFLDLREEGDQFLELLRVLKRTAAKRSPKAGPKAITTPWLANNPLIRFVTRVRSRFTVTNSRCSCRRSSASTIGTCTTLHTFRSPPQ